MPYTLGNLQTDIGHRIAQETGTVTTSIITNYANESLRRLRRKFDMPSAEVITQFALYTGVYQYAIPYAGYKEFVALRDNYRMPDTIFMRNVSESVFWENLQSGNTKSEARNGTGRQLLFNLLDPPTSHLTVNGAVSSTSDGTWVASGDANTVGDDTLFFRTGSGSLKFNITTSTGTATLTNSTMSPKDVSGIAYLNTGMFTMWVYLPSATNFTNFSLKWGSSATVYWTNTVTAQIDGSAFTQGWNMLGFDWITATSSGSPTSTDAAAIDYLQLTATLPLSMANQTAIRVNDIRVRQRRIFNLHSTTDYLVIDGTTGAAKEQFASGTDTSSHFNCDASFVDFLQYEILEQVFTTHINDPDSRNHYMMKRMELENDLIMRFPSKRQPEIQQYADTTQRDSWLKRAVGK